MDTETRRAISKLTAELARTQAELARVKRGSRRPQLGRSSIDSGALEVRDPETGATRLRLGYQPDGTVGAVPEGGDPPPAPTTPRVEPIASGLRVWWDGQLLDGAAMPGDFDHVNVYVSAESGFTPGSATFAGTIHRDGGPLPVAPLEIGTRHYARLVGVGTGGVQGEPSQQSSGVPESVTDIEPGSITETEIADDAITTPKIRAEAIQALHIAAEQIQAGHIEAAAITAAHLEAELVLGSRIVAGDPGGARVEMDEHGLRGYTGSGELAFAIQDGDAVFSGRIQGAEIAGSRMTIGQPQGASGVIGEQGDIIYVTGTAPGGERAQLAATADQAEFTAWADVDEPDSPLGGLLAHPGGVQMSLYSDGSDSSAPRSIMSATPDLARAFWRGPDGSEVRMSALPEWSAFSALPPVSTVGEPEASAGVMYAFRRAATDTPTLSAQSPAAQAGLGEGHRSVIHVEGGSDAQPYARLSHHAYRHSFQGEMISGSLSDGDGYLDVNRTHSISSVRHRPVRQEMVSQPTAASPSAGAWNAFTSAQWPQIVFRTSWSGRVRITIMMCGINPSTNASSLATGFALAGASNFAPVLGRAAFIRSVGAGNTPSRQGMAVVYLHLWQNEDYVLTPHWRTSGTTTWGGSNQSYDLSLDNSITVEPLM